MSNETELAELRGRVMVLERLLTDTLLKELVDIKLRAINAESNAVRAAEIVQSTISEFNAGGVESFDDGAVDIRGGVVNRRGKKEEEDS